MSRAKLQSSILDLVSDSEDDFSGLGIINSVQKPASTKMPPKKGKGRAAANKVTKPAPKTSASSRRASGRVAAAIDMETEREALTEKSNNSKPKAPAKRRRGAAAKEDVEMEDEAPLATPPTSDVPAKPKGRGRPKKVAQEEEEAEVPDSTGKEPSRAAANKRDGRKTKKATPPPRADSPEVTTEYVTEIPETQPQDTDLDAMEVDIEDEETEDLPLPETAEFSRKGKGSSSPQKPSSAGSDGSDPALRRRLGEMTRKYESLESKYRDLRELAVKDAETNFDRLKKQAEEKANTSKELIASLKAELAAQKELAREGNRLKKQLDASEAKSNSLQSRVTEMTSSLSESKAEIKSLNMKLTASRNAEAAAAAKSVPGSAMKGNLIRPMANSEAIQQATKSSQMKLDLYGDLSGLIIRSIKREGDEDVYDCIQTGRDSRTLHFKLSICNDPTSEDYEEAEFLYQPFLDESRDRELIDNLPNYLVDEITFPRHQCAKFYAKVLEALHQKDVE